MAPTAPTPVASARKVALRGLTAFALLWQVLWVATDPALWPARQSGPLLMTIGWLAVMSWTLLLTAHLRRAAWIAWAARANVLGLLLAAGGLILAQALTAQPVWGSVTNLLALALGSAGLLLPLRSAAVIVVTGVLIDAALITETLLPDPMAPFHGQQVLYSAFALTVGVVTIAARLSLTRAAARVDAATASAARLEQNRVATESAEGAIREQQRLLHGTVLNTLVAVERGGLTDTPGVRHRLVQRCLESVEVLHAVLSATTAGTPAQPRQDLLEDIAGELADLRAAGVRVTADCDTLDELPAPVYLAVCTAVREALSNVHRHAAAGEAWIQARAYRVRDTTSLEVEVGDDGGGFDSTAVSGRYGIAAAIKESMGEVGGRADVSSDPLSGTRVRLSWERELAAPDESALVPSTAVFAIPVLAVFAVYTALIALLGSSPNGVGAADAVAFTLLLGVYALVVAASLRGPVPAWVVAVSIAGGLAVPVIVQSGGIGTGPWSDWSSIGVVALFLVLASGGPSWAWVAVLVAWLVLQGDILGELTSPGTAVLAAGALFGRSVRRSAARMEVTLAYEERAAMALAIAERRVQGLLARYGALSVTGAASLLGGLADGQLDPDDPRVRQRAAVEERFIRNVIRVDPRGGPVSALAMDVATAARAHGVPLSVHLGAVDEDRAIIPPGVRASFLAAIGAADPAESARLSAGRESDAIVLRLVVTIETAEGVRMRLLPVPGMDLDPDGLADRMMLWEAHVAMGDDR